MRGKKFKRRSDPVDDEVEDGFDDDEQVDDDGFDDLESYDDDDFDALDDDLDADAELDEIDDELDDDLFEDDEPFDEPDDVDDTVDDVDVVDDTDEDLDDELDEDLLAEDESFDDDDEAAPAGPRTSLWARIRPSRPPKVRAARQPRPVRQPRAVRPPKPARPVRPPRLARPPRPRRERTVRPPKVRAVRSPITTRPTAVLPPVQVLSPQRVRIVPPSRWSDTRTAIASRLADARSNNTLSSPVVIRIVVGLALLIGGYFVYDALTAGRKATIVVDNESGTTIAPTTTVAAAPPQQSTGAAAPLKPTPLVSSAALTSTSALADPTTVALTTVLTTTVPPTTAVPIPPATVAPTTVAPATTVAPGSAMQTFPVPDGPVTYSTLPDGSPSPVLAIFDVDTITLSGTVPTEAAKEKLQTLALANSKTPAAVQNLLVIDPTVPVGVGVRVIELTSTRFPEGSARILPEHAKEFDRIVALMNALPSTTALVIGHADQLGSDDANQAISESRAAAVVDYMVSAGIDPSRLASRAVGASDLLTLNDDDASLALNRRTEFVVYGLLLG